MTRYLEIAIDLTERADGSFDVKARGPAGQASERFRPPFSLAEIAPALAVGGVRRGAVGSDGDETLAAVGSPDKIGVALYQSLFQGGLADILARTEGLAATRPDGGVRLRMNFNLLQDGTAAVAALPWELMRKSIEADPLLVSTQTVLVRSLDVNKVVTPRPIDGPLRVLLIRANPKGTAALDLDREGELIGLETLDAALDVNPELGPTVRRARYSALTRDEIERAFSHLDELSYPLAHAGGARQDIDLYWGATLTRAVSLVSRAYGSNFLSVGRVQSPTLGLIVERELERRAHVAEPFWELFAKFAHPDGTFQAHHATDKFWDEAEAKAALEATTGIGTVESLTSRKNTSKPPTPYNTNSFQVDASSRLGITPKRAMSLAEDLYMDGFISYPRTDNTVYPESLPLKETIQALVKIDDFSQAAYLLDGPLQPTRGKKEDQAHPPIYPTQAVYPSALPEDKRRVYELVVRRFLATFAGPMISESTRADISIGGQTYFVRGKVVLDPGYAGIYHYSRSDDDEIPALEEGQKLELDGTPWLEEKETQ